MRSKIFTIVAAIALLALAVSARLAAQTNYTVVRLGALGGTQAAANSINDRGWAAGFANQEGDSVGHAALWVGASQPTDLGALGGPNSNSAVAWPVSNNIGLVVGISDTGEDNPLGEAFSCWPFFTPGAPTGKICKGFRWVNGVMTPLPPFPGGYNSYATSANNRGQVVGWAENGVHDPTCDPAFQVLQFRAVIWQPNGEMQELPPLPGDSTSAATAINDKGQVVGISGACGIAVGGVSAAHSVLWENGVPTNIGDLGGHTWNTPTAINDQGTVVGFSLPAGQDGTRNYEAFLWTKAGGIQRLGKLPGDIRAGAFGVNEKNQVVGLSRGGPYLFRAFIWQSGGVLTDLNTLTVPGSPFLLYANDINDAGEIAGQAFDPSTSEAPAFVAFPVAGRAAAAAHAGDSGAQQGALPERLRQQLQRRPGLDPFGIGSGQK